MKCPSCQAEINEGKKFCPKCGTNLAEYVEKAAAKKAAAEKAAAEKAAAEQAAAEQAEAEKKAAEEKAMAAKAEAAEKAYRVGRDFYDVKDYDSAISRLSEYISFAAPVVANDSQNADAYRCRGDSYWAKKQYDEAIKDFNSALNIEPKSAFAYERRGDCHFNKGQYDKATGDFNIALNIDPESVIAKGGLNAAKVAAEEAAAAKKAAKEKAAAEKVAAEKAAVKKAADDKAAMEKAIADSSMYAECNGKVRYIVKHGERIQKWDVVFDIKAGILNSLLEESRLRHHKAIVSGEVQYVIPNGSNVKQGELVARIL